MKSFVCRVAASVAVAALATSSLFAAGRGRADFTRYVALGDSYGAGYVNDSLVLSHQVHSYPAVIARQAGTPDFQQPLISEPGIPPELRLVSISPLVIARKSTTNGQPINLLLPRAYNNLSIPGARVNDLLTLTGSEPRQTNPFYQIILRGKASAVDQALLLNPTFITIGIGGNDVLGAILGGTPALLTPLDAFTRDYNALLTKLTAGAPNAGMTVYAGLPALLRIPYATTIPPVVINPSTGQPVLIGGNPVFLIAEGDNGVIGPLPPGSLALLPVAQLLATGYGIPTALAPTLPNAGKPIPGQYVLTPTEIAAITKRAQEIDAVIRSAAASHNIPVTDLAPLMNRLTSAQGYTVAGVQFTSAFLTGGMFSYDGFHPTDIGYTLIANEFIRTINRNYGTRIPLASITPFFENNAPVEASLIDPEMVATTTFAPLVFDNLYATFIGDALVSAPERVDSDASDQ